METSPRLALASAAVIVLTAVRFDAGQQGNDTFAFFQPSVRVSAADMVRLEKGDVVVRILPADDGHLAVFAAARLNAAPDALLDWTQAIAAFKRGPLVLAVGRFSDPVADSDLDGMVLEDSELEALRRCRAGSCDIKLAAAEIGQIQDTMRAAGKDWREPAQRAFRRILISRVRMHRDGGLLALPPYADRGRRMSVGEAFSAITARSPYLTRTCPEVINSLLTPRQESVAAGDSLYYWSREKYGAGRTVVNITYVRLLRADDAVMPQALTVSTQLFASHYIEGALGVTAVVCDAARTRCYLAYVNRTQVDLLGGLFGAFKRALIEDRIEADAPKLFRGLKQRLESGSPGSDGADS